MSKDISNLTQYTKYPIIYSDICSFYTHAVKIDKTLTNKINDLHLFYLWNRLKKQFQ